MCTEFLKRMDNYHQGDLADIVRASGGSVRGGGSVNSAAQVEAPTSFSDYWQFPNNPIINSYSDDNNSCDDFGDPFTHVGDPLLHHDIHTPVSVSGFFNGQNIIIKSNKVVQGSTATTYRGFESTGGGYNNSIINENDAHHKINLDHIDEMKRSVIPSDIFSIRMLQISPAPCDPPVVVASAGSSPRGLINASSMLLTNNHTRTNNGSKVCLAESPAGLQISSPRNTGIKRRKSQAKKVVCIPAPAPANTRHSGEVVPSDLWAWRKYGQKPIKGSPNPRGYYRCSSSKGCSARKQVERSRTDPNMLVITYTSEHNHPWPTQRNALAGSTRSHPIKNNYVPKNTTNSDNQAQKSNEEKKEITTDATDDHKNTAVLKEETDQDFESDQLDDAEFDEGIPQSYKPTIPADSDHSEDFFADLGEIEADPLDLSFTQGFSGENVKALDQYTFYDNWPATNNQYSAADRNTIATTSYGEAKKDSK